MYQVWDATNTLCGGAILTPSWVLTAAHCYQTGIYPGGDTLSNSYILFSEHAISDPDDNGATVVQAIYMHPSWNLNTIVYDLALTEAFSALLIDFTMEGVAPVCLPDPSAPTSSYDGLTGTISGWGLTAEVADGGAVSDTLQEADTNVVDQATCLGYYGSGIVEDAHICTLSDPGTGIAPCSGDSGGPLTVTRDDGRAEVAGIASFAPNGDCGYGTIPAIYARVSTSMTWIESTMGGAQCDLLAALK